MKVHALGRALLCLCRCPQHRDQSPGSHRELTAAIASMHATETLNAPLTSAASSRHSDVTDQTDRVNKCIGSTLCNRHQSRTWRGPAYTHSRVCRDTHIVCVHRRTSRRTHSEWSSVVPTANSTPSDVCRVQRRQARRKNDAPLSNGTHSDTQDVSG
jgi:hypothetical protein